MSVLLPTVPTTNNDPYAWSRGHPTFHCAGCHQKVIVTQVCSHCNHEYCEACYTPWFGMCCTDCRLFTSTPERLVG